MTHSTRDVHSYATWLPWIAWCALGGVIYDGRFSLVLCPLTFEPVCVWMWSVSALGFLQSGW